MQGSHARQQHNAAGLLWAWHMLHIYDMICIAPTVPWWKLRGVQISKAELGSRCNAPRLRPGRQVLLQVMLQGRRLDCPASCP